MTFKSIKSKIICGFMSCVAVAAIAFGVVLVIALEFQADNRANIASSAAADAASRTVKATVLADAAVSRYLVSASATDKSVMTQRLKDVAALSTGDTGAVEQSANTTAELITKTQLSSVVVLDQTSALSSSVGTLGEIAASANDVDSNTLVEQVSQFYGFSALNVGRYVARQDPPALTAGKDGLKRMVDASAQIQALPNASKRLKKVAAIVARDSQALSDAVDDLSTQFDSRNQALKTLQGIFTAIATGAQAKLDAATGTMADLRAQADVSSNRLMLSLMAGAPAVLLIGIVLAIFIGGSISKPIVALTRSVRLIADGDYHAAVPGQDRADEIGKMAASVLILEEKAREREQLENERREESEARVRRADLLDRLVKDFDLSSRRVIEGFLSSANDLSQTANQLADNSAKTSAQAVTTSAAATQTSSNVTTVAAAAQELQASIEEINNKVVQSADKANEAADIAQKTFDTINELAEAGSEIGDVIKLISAIASQTNLLALNATIEAARAGEAGRGFAIVATEVKTLASQTSSATSQISDKISRIQNITMTAGTAIESIRGAIGSINHMSAAIASAMTEQSSATEEIARSIDEAARGADNVTETISVVSRAADEVRDASRRTQQSTARLGDEATALSEQITQFLGRIRAG